MKSYFVAKLLGKNPVSRKFGLDRGEAIDRYYIEKFLFENRQHIKGKVLEIAESTYTKKFGENKVEEALVLHVSSDMDADIVGNLETGEGIPENMIDCFILTQTLPFIYDIKSTVKNCMRILKSGGHLLITVPGITQISRYDMERWGHFWSFTDLSLRRLFEDNVPPEVVQLYEVASVDEFVSEIISPEQIEVFDALN